MMNLKSVSLLAFALAAALGSTASSAAIQSETSTLTVSATLVAACEVSPASSIVFGDIVALLSSGNQEANTAGTFQVACSADTTPAIYATGARELGNGTDTIPFSLSLASGGIALSDNAETPSVLSITKDGSFQPVTLYSRLLAANFADKSEGAYNAELVVHVVY